MSSRDLTRRALLGSLALGAALATAGCLRPLYGPTPSGVPLAQVLASIDVDQITAGIGQERFSHYVRSELIFELNGTGVPGPKRYRLVLNVSQTVQTPIVDTLSGRADSATLNGRVEYTLFEREGNRVVTQGIATSTASYDRNPQRFATVRAARDADIRLAKLLAEQIRTRLAAALATGRT